MTSTVMPEADASGNQSRWPRGLRALRHRNYRLYFLGQTISMAGTWMQNVAQGWLVLTLTHSPFSLGIVITLQSAPVLLFSLLGGVLADRVPKYRLMAVTQSVMALLALILAIDVTAGTVQIWHIYILAALLGSTNAMNLPTQQALAVELVGKDDLLNAIALNSAIVNTARIVGPALAGILIALVGVALCFFLNSLSFVAVIGGLLLMRPNEFAVHARSRRSGSIVRELSEGLGFVRRSWPAKMIMLIALAFGAFGWTQNVVFPVFATSVLHVGSVGYGVMTSAFGIGALGTVAVIAQASRAHRSRMFAGVAGAILFSLAFAASRFYPLSLVLLAGLGASTFLFATQTNTLLQTLAPDELRGRVISLYMMLFVGSQPLGAFLTGWLASAFGAPVALSVDVLIIAVVLLAVLAYERTLPQSVREIVPQLSET